MNHAALRIWLDTPNLMMSYERKGITIITVSLRTEAAKAAAAALGERLTEYREDGDPGRVEALGEVLDMVREALNGGPGQLLPLDSDVVSVFDDLLGEVS